MKEKLNEYKNEEKIINQEKPGTAEKATQTEFAFHDLLSYSMIHKLACDRNAAVNESYELRECIREFYNKFIDIPNNFLPPPQEVTLEEHKESDIEQKEIDTEQKGREILSEMLGEIAGNNSNFDSLE